MLNAKVGGDLGFSNAVLDSIGRALSLDKVTVEGLLSLEGLCSLGMVGLPGGQVFGDLNCAGANLQSDDIALNLATATIRGHVYLKDGFRCSGKINMHSAQVGNSVDCSGAVITGLKSAFFLEESSVRGTVYLCDGFSSSASVQVTGAQLRGNLACDGASLTALYCANMHLEGDLIWTSIQHPERTSLWLNGASIKSLRDDRESWPAPGGLHIDGLVYQELTLHDSRTEEDRQKNSLAREHELRVGDRIAWLGLQLPEDKTEPQPWMQLAGLLKAKGDNQGAKRVIFEMRRSQAAANSAFARLCKILFARLEEQPLRIFFSITFFTLVGSGIFWYAGYSGGIAPTNKDAYIAWSKGTKYEAAYPRFNPVIYSLENGLPLVKLGQDDKWAPDPSHRSECWLSSYLVLTVLRWFLILAGWVQATVLASAIGSRFKN